MKQSINLETWNRKDHYRFFSAFSHPFFSVTVQVPVAKAYRFAKKEGISFFLYYLYLSLKAANLTEAFRYRIENDTVVLYDAVNASPTINRNDGTFGFAYMDYSPERSVFLELANREIKRVQSSTGLIPAVAGENVIHYSSIPWINFTALTHASNTAFKDCIPKITFGKMTGDPDSLMMPLSVHLHHGLADAFHAAQFIDTYTELLQQ